MYTNDEIPKYKKKAIKTVKKSKHKHIYKDCLIHDANSRMYHKSSYCSICGKIGDFGIIETEKVSGRLSRVLSQDELLERYKDLEIKEVCDIVKTKVINMDNIN